MTVRTSIRLVPVDNNTRGDLFARLMGDLFVALGYDNVRMNIARSGREIDIEADHRLEKRRALAECKAWDRPVGGKEINAFAGKLRPERGRKLRQNVTPYFISLSGFTEPSIDQENEAGDEAVILVDGARVLVELVKGRILVPVEKATEKAGQCVAGLQDLQLDDQVDLLAQPIGWIWAVYYMSNGRRTHVALVHADGTLLSRSLASEVLTSDDDVSRSLVCLNPEHTISPDTIAQSQAAFKAYYEYLSIECGFILLDGLPADAEVGALRLRLENLFVPLQLLHFARRPSIPYEKPIEEKARERSSKAAHQLSLPLDIEDFRFEYMPEPLSDVSRDYRRAYRVPVGKFLLNAQRLAVLGVPGSGKSTLIKRLAVGYADPSRRGLVNDGLPNENWIPLFFRCRELQEKARAPFSELLDAIAARAFITEHARVFRDFVEQAMRAGNVLLLVDGLDEIADAGARAAFVHNIRTMLAIYPRVKAVVTSRQAGFRHVAGLLAPICVQTEVAGFRRDDITRLTVAWHREVVGDRAEVIREAERLAATICDNSRIRQLAVNPLLLTTLLLVKRWVGSLPTRRSVLYGKAVEVLLMTWNVEAHEPIEQEEALPQLCYVAYAMMRRGIQKISRTELTRLLFNARKELPAELAFARIGVGDFIERVEHRSSLLIMTGHEVVDGSLVELYEFRHLTFQEYLTAKAIVEGWHQDRQESDSIVSILQPHFAEEKWREVIPLAAVLAGRKADPLIVALAQRASGHTYLALATCLTDEVQATPDVIRTAIAALLAKYKTLLASNQLVERLTMGKYGALFREEVSRQFLAEPTELRAALLGHVIATQLARNGETQPEIESQVSKLLMSADTARRCEGALCLYRLQSIMMLAAFSRTVGRLIMPLLRASNAEKLAACLALGQERAWKWAAQFSEFDRDFQQLIKLWVASSEREISMAAQHAIARLPVLPRDVEYASQEDTAGTDEYIRNTLHHERDATDARAAALVACYYRRAPISGADFLRLAAGYAAPKQPWRMRARQVVESLTA